MRQQRNSPEPRDGSGTGRGNPPEAGSDEAAASWGRTFTDKSFEHPRELVGKALRELHSTLNLGRGRHAKGWSPAQRIRAAGLRFRAARLVLSYALPKADRRGEPSEEADDADAALKEMLAAIDAREAEAAEGREAYLDDEREEADCSGADEDADAAQHAAAPGLHT